MWYYHCSPSLVHQDIYNACFCLLYYCFSLTLLLTNVISLCLVTTLKIFTLEKNIIELSSLRRNECRYFHVQCILQHKEDDDGKMENKSRYYKTNLHCVKVLFFVCINVRCLDKNYKYVDS